MFTKGTRDFTEFDFAKLEVEVDIYQILSTVFGRDNFTDILLQQIFFKRTFVIQITFIFYQYKKP